jgi:hypothetical protein
MELLPSSLQLPSGIWSTAKHLSTYFNLSCGGELTAPKTVQPSLASIFFRELLVPHRSGEEQVLDPHTVLGKVWDGCVLPRWPRGLEKCPHQPSCLRVPEQPSCSQFCPIEQLKGFWVILSLAGFPDPGPITNTFLTGATFSFITLTGQTPAGHKEPRVSALFQTLITSVNHWVHLGLTFLPASPLHQMLKMII